MATQEKYFPGTAVSRYLSPFERSWDETVYQSGKPVLDPELILSQEVVVESRRIQQERLTPSGFLRGPTPFDPRADFLTGSTPNTIRMRKRSALVANLPVVVEYAGTTTAGMNVIPFSAAPLYGGAPPDVKRTDFVFLEVWRCVVSMSPHATATIGVITNGSITAGDRININGSPLTAVAGAPAADQFQIGANAVITASNIYTAINLSSNSFLATTTATISPANTSLVNLRASDTYAGAAGNALTLSLTLTTAGALQVNSGPGPTLFAGGLDTPNKPTQSTLYRHGNTEAPSGVNLADDIADPIVGSESTKRVQVQYRFRVTGQAEAVNFKTQNGFDNVNVLARGATSAPVAGYRFVPADGSTIAGSSSAVAYGIIDSGLWIAGDGTLASANALGTVDGYVYAIPVGMIYRRNDAFDGGAGDGFDPLNNTNGALPSTHTGFINPIIGSIPAGVSDRPDGRFHDILLGAEFTDLRKEITPGGLDLVAELDRQMSFLLDGQLGTWAIDAADKNELGGGSGDVGLRFLVCNEIGRSSAKGGVAPSSGDTTRGDSIGDFDHIRRRFADWPVVERVVLPILPTATSVVQPGLYVTKVNSGYATWQEGDEINIDLSQLDATGLGDWLNAPSGAPTGGGSVSSLWPMGTKVTNVIGVYHDDGNYNAAISKDVQIDRITGLGTTLLTLLLAENNAQATGGVNVASYPLVGPNPGTDTNSPRRIWIELEVSYPRGQGTTDTVDEVLSPTASVYPVGPVIEDAIGQRSDDWEALLSPTFRTGRREVGVEYVANDGSGAGAGTPIVDSVVSDNRTLISLPRRAYGSATTTVSVTDTVSTLSRTVNTATTRWGSSDRQLVLTGATPLSGAGQTLASVEYFAQDPLPNWGAVGYQIAVYFRSTAPQTVGTQSGSSFPLPDPITLKPLVMSQKLWTCTVGAGSPDLAYPYLNPSDSIAVNADINPFADFPGEWVMDAYANISIGDFNAATGMLSLTQLVAVDSTQDFVFSDLDRDVGFRTHYKTTDPTAYRPTAAAQPLSGPVTHKTWFPFLAVSQEDTTLFRKGEVLLVVVSRLALLENNNQVVFTDTNNNTCAAIYRTRGYLLLATE